LAHEVQTFVHSACLWERNGMAKTSIFHLYIKKYGGGAQRKFEFCITGAKSKLVLFFLSYLEELIIYLTHFYQNPIITQSDKINTLFGEI
jgi:hypothetical protein